MTTAAPPAPGGGRVTLGRVVAAEWLKLRTLRSTVWTALAGALLLVGLGLLLCAVVDANWDRNTPAERATFSPISASLAGAGLAQIAAVVLGALAVTGEYSTGMIRASLTAVPRRLPVLWAKLVVVPLAVLVLGVVGALAAFLGGQALLGSHGTDLSAPHAVRAVAGVGLYLAALAALAVSLGFVLRSTAATIAVVLAVLLVLPPLSLLLPSSWRSHVRPYLPSEAGTRLIDLSPPDTGALGPWTGYAVLLLEVAVVTAAAAVLLRRRDA